MSDKIRLLMKLRKTGITDTTVLSAIEQVPRELFVGESFVDQAYEDTALPIDACQTISQPTVVAWMTWALGVTDRMRVLEIGTGSGYQTAILSKLCRMVYTIERHAVLKEQAEACFKELKLNNIITKVADGSQGWKEGAPFDRIIVTAAASEVPKELLEQLAIDGVMVIPVGNESNGQMLLRLHKTKDGIESKHLMGVRFVPLVQGETE